MRHYTRVFSATAMLYLASIGFTIASAGSINTGVIISSNGFQLGLDVVAGARSFLGGDTLGAALATAGGSTTIAGVVEVANSVTPTGALMSGATRAIANAGGSVTGISAAYNWLSYASRSWEYNTAAYSARGSIQTYMNRYEAAGRRVKELQDLINKEGC